MGKGEIVFGWNTTSCGFHDKCMSCCL